ncbi:hypothetical protein SALBM217S_01325 [Streptomyces griseoloalbus]
MRTPARGTPSRSRTQAPEHRPGVTGVRRARRRRGGPGRSVTAPPPWPTRSASSGAAFSSSRPGPAPRECAFDCSAWPASSGRERTQGPRRGRSRLPSSARISSPNACTAATARGAGFTRSRPSCGSRASLDRTPPPRPHAVAAARRTSRRLPRNAPAAHVERPSPTPAVRRASGVAFPLGQEPFELAADLVRRRGCPRARRACCRGWRRRRGVVLVLEALDEGGELVVALADLAVDLGLGTLGVGAQRVRDAWQDESGGQASSAVAPPGSERAM